MVAERGEVPRGVLESPAAADREWKMFCYELKALADVTQVLQSETGGSEGETLAFSGKNVDFSKVILMIDGVAALPTGEQGEDDEMKVWCIKSFDETEETIPSRLEKRIQEGIVEEIFGAPVPEMKEKLIETVERVPQEQVQCIDKTVDVSILRQVQVPTVRAVQKTVVLPQVQFPARLVGDPVLTFGTAVQFELCCGGDGKLKAKCVQVRASNVAESQSMLGRVKIFWDKYCFVTSDCVEGDIFLVKEEIPDEWNFLQVGVPLRFRHVPESDKLKACSAKMLVMTLRSASVKSCNPASHYGFFSCDGLDEDVWVAEAVFARRQPAGCPEEEDSNITNELQFPAHDALAQAERFKRRFHVCLTAQTKEPPTSRALDRTHEEHQEGYCAKQEQNLSARQIWYKSEGRSRPAEVTPGREREAEENARKDLGITRKDQIYLVAGGKVVSSEEVTKMEAEKEKKREESVELVRRELDGKNIYSRRRR